MLLLIQFGHKHNGSADDAMTLMGSDVGEVTKKINCQNYLDVWRWIGSRGSDAFPRTKARGFREGDHSVSPVLNKHDLDTILIKALNYYHWIGHWSTGNEYILDLSWKTSFVNLYFQNCIGVIRLNLKGEVRRFFFICSKFLSAQN